MVIKRIDIDPFTGEVKEVPLDAPNPPGGDIRPFSGLNHYSEAELQATRLHDLGIRLFRPPPLAEIDSFRVQTLDEAYRSGRITAGHRRELLLRLRKLQKQLDRQHKRREQ